MTNAVLASDGGLTIGVDTGGTFTDIVLVGPSGDLAFAKAPTTPHRFEDGVMSAIAGLAGALNISVRGLLDRTAVIKHGTTVATNALITRRGVRVGLITTAGFEDTLAIMRAIGRVDGLPNEEVRQVTTVQKPEPLVPRERVAGVRERVDSTGGVVVPLTTSDARAAIKRLVDGEGCEAIAVCLLNSWVNPVHEMLVDELVRSTGANVFMSFSHQLARVAGEYARANTTVVNCYVGPTVRDYLGNLEKQLRAQGFAGTFLVMQGNGGASTPTSAAPIASLQSGPAAGMYSSAAMSDMLGHRRVVTADMGGTSLDVSVIADGVLKYSDESVFDRLRILQPIVEITSIGAGGGTLATVDSVGGRLQVGPDSAGAAPGPVAYGQGGVDPTITDADLVLGFVDPARFLGGRKSLDRDAAREAIRNKVADPLGISIEAAATGIVEIVNNKMADLIRREIVRSGYHPEEFALYAFGGAGPVHAVGFGRELGVGEIVVFPTSPVFSAFGAAISDIVHSAVQTYEVTLPGEPGDLNDLLATVEERLLGLALTEGYTKEDVEFRRIVSMRYQRQTHGIELELRWPRLGSSELAALIEDFHATYEDVFGAGAGFGAAGTQISRVRVDLVAPVRQAALSPTLGRQESTESARTGERQVYMDGRWLPVVLFEYDAMLPGMSVAGPAILESAYTNVVVPHGWRSAIDEYRNVRITRSDGG